MTTFTQLPRCAGARVRHRGMAHCAAADCQGPCHGGMAHCAAADCAWCAGCALHCARWCLAARVYIAMARSCLRVCITARDACVCTYMAHCVATGAQRRCVWCDLRDADYAAAVGVITHVLVVACSACAEVIWVDVIKRCTAVCTYAWVRCRYGV